VEKLEAALDAVNERLKLQDARIQKVSAQVAMSKPAPRVVANSPYDPAAKGSSTGDSFQAVMF
jgi:hypothetical protein